MGINKYVGAFLAIGLFDAGFLGAICISLASSWAFGEVFGWAHSLNHKVKEAPWFYAYYFFDLLLAGTVVLIPGAPLVLITLFVQVIAVTLLPAALVFLIVLLNDEETMGKLQEHLVPELRQHQHRGDDHHRFYVCTASARCFPIFSNNGRCTE